MLKQKESLIQQAEALKTIPIDIEARTVEKVRVCILDELAFAKSIWPGDAPLNAGQFEEGKFGLSPEPSKLRASLSVFSLKQPNE